MADKDLDVNPLSSFSGDGSNPATVPFLLCPPTQDISLNQQSTSESDQAELSHNKQDLPGASSLPNTSVAG